MDERTAISDPVDAAIAVALRTGDQSAIASMLPPGTDERLIRYFKTRKMNVGRVRNDSNFARQVAATVRYREIRAERGCSASQAAEQLAIEFDLPRNIIEAICAGRINRRVREAAKAAIPTDVL